ncbi:MAG TPA: hypothetical protein VNY27_10575 [Solirubrobacteraceae bacterium]|nr:hypothetical protein [Solirubrobacteraceae bacterium]
MLAIALWEIVLPLHILAVVFAFGATFAYPVMLTAVTRANPRSLPELYRAMHEISRRVIMPGLGAVIVFGVYLASDLHDWGEFFVQWGLIVAIVIGAIEGVYMSPREQRLIEVADRDVAQAGNDGEVTFSAEHDALVRRVGGMGALLDLLVVVTIFLMAIQA